MIPDNHVVGRELRKMNVNTEQLCVTVEADMIEQIIDGPRRVRPEGRLVDHAEETTAVRVVEGGIHPTVRSGIDRIDARVRHHFKLLTDSTGVRGHLPIVKSLMEQRV